MRSIIELVRLSLWSYGGSRTRLVILAALSLATGALEAGSLYLIANIGLSLAGDGTFTPLDLGPVHLDDVSGVIWLAGITVTLLLAIAYPLATLTASISRISLSNVRARIIESYFAAPWALRATEREASLHNLAVQHASYTEQMVQQSVTLLVNGLGLLVLLSAAVVISPVGMAALAPVTLALVLAMRPMTRRLRAISERAAAAEREYASLVAQGSRLSQEIATFNVASPVTMALTVHLGQHSGELFRVRRLSRLTPTVFQYAAMGTVVLLAGVAQSFDSSRLDAVAPLVLLLVRSLSYARQFVGSLHVAQEFAPHAEGIRTVVSQYREAAETSASTTAEPTSMTPIRVQNVCFAFGAGTPTLNDLTFTVRPGEIVGVVGPSGVGKSTLLEVVLGLRAPTSGHVSLDGTRMHLLPGKERAAAVGFAPQESRVILGTLRENIRFYRSSIEDLEIEHAATITQLVHGTSRLDYNTLVGPGAHTLSGGQRQRLGIARALAGRPRFLVLDEPTSALDTESEEIVREALLKIRDAGVGVLLVAHRGAALSTCDRILSLSQDGVSISPPAVSEQT